MRLTWRSWRALWVVFWILIRYRVALARSRRTTDSAENLERLHRRTAARLRQLFMEQRGLYIKVGQLISILATVLPPAFREEFSALQDQVDPVPTDLLRARLVEQWKRPPGEVLAELEDKPIAAASVGQVHRGRLHDGRQVAVKIQYPGIEVVFAQDMRAFYVIVRLIGWFFPNPELVRIYDELKMILEQEVDFTLELESLQRFRMNFSASQSVTAPAPVLDWCTSKVLVTEYVEGVKINNLAGLKELGVSPDEAASLLVETYAAMFFEHGFYHADPHPGNVWVQSGPRLCFMDFGACSAISDRMREGMVAFVQAGVRKDTSGLVAAMRKMGFIPTSADPRVYDRVVAYFHDQFQEKIGIENLRLGNLRFSADSGLKNLQDLKGMNISLKDIAASFHIPREWVMLERTLLQILGLVTVMAPELDVMEVFLPHLRRFSISYGLDPSSLALQAMRELAKNALALPSELRGVLSRLTYGEIELRLADAEYFIKTAHAWVHEGLFAGLGVFFLWSGWRFEEQGEDTRAAALFFASVACGLLFLKYFFGSTRQKRK
jgi:predicted unusual protein kinase regulating ubiquinone biosynthesis (AarF/ABC1/UbiB family)